MTKTNTEIAENTFQAGTANSGSETASKYSVSHMQTHEQFFSPISIKRNQVSKNPGFQKPHAQIGEDGIFQNDCAGPSIGELNPYFSKTFANSNTFLGGTDFVGIVHDVGGAKPTNLNIRVAEDDPNDISNVRINALRGPLILSGWGFGIDDMPVPPSGGGQQQVGGALTFPHKVRHDPGIGHDRRTWKTGPINLLWDDERQVWQGGLPVVCGIAQTAIEAPDSPCNPTKFTIRVFRNTGSSEDFTGPITTALGETVVINNRDMSLEEDYISNAIFVIAMKINYEWLPIWVGCPEEAPEDTECIPEAIFAVH
jgi:hypothetical protein